MSSALFKRSDQTAQQILKADILQPILLRRRPQRVLVLGHARADDVPLESTGRAQIISLGANNPAHVPLRCRIEALPFGDTVFELVVLQHLVHDGSEAVFCEALRVLKPGGDLVISGLNASGLRYLLGKRQACLPGLRIHPVMQQLTVESFIIVRCLRTGLLGLSRPASLDSWHGLVLPFVDHIVLHALHHSGVASGNVLRFKQAQAGGVVSAAFEICSDRVVKS